MGVEDFSARHGNAFGIDTIASPAGDRLGADAVIETDGEFVPIKHRPLEASAVLLACNGSKMRHQTSTSTGATLLDWRARTLRDPESMVCYLH